ncbi:SGNH/GDSL hydrolase family protein [Mucilaginibacter sp. BT774]|uniref:SGNH/GDSL hydrolase family protein n=1 Tax=Mucilaginibacter sp. BT774 TaxID=3062276 RepID=UPI0026746237|nr:SGNH/GDSL hydrolase family protein [Mucilaginibacter sp. BT774]MDO3628371.1 SGNH/GDSL hydrolase family protein [Mucilaginibacter sp. BT774]
MNVKLFVIISYLVFQCSLVHAQETGNYTWWDPAKNDVPVIEGQAWPQEVKNPYDRLPARAEKIVRPRVWELSHDAAGLSVSFMANSSEIVVRYRVKNGQAFPHMPATGVSGVDLYAVNSDGDWIWAAGKYTFGDTITFRFKGLNPNDAYHEHGRRYKLYLPLYNTVEWLQIGVPKETSFVPLPLSKEKPIVVYGTSIVQGAAASRPGMAWTSILSRKMERPLINLGFSGNARLDSEIVDLMSEIDAKIFILDCLPNLVYGEFTPEVIKNKILNAVTKLRQQQKTTPILLIQHDGYADAEIDTTRKKLYADVNVIQEAAFNQLKAAGIDGIYLLSKEAIGQTIDCTVDGTHPSDLGMMHYAEASEKIIRQILNEPVGILSTTRPRTQNRDANTYDWQSRHNEQLGLNKAAEPCIVFIGNSITHYWGGKPAAPISRGSDSWNKYLAPLGVRNFGFGWDRVENALWRVYHDELDGYTARQVIILIGTNNLSVNSNTEILEGLKLLVEGIKGRQPQSDILLLGILPRRNQESRVLQLNSGIKELSKSLHVKYADVGKSLLYRAKINEQLFVDGLHPNAEGYNRVAQMLLPYLRKAGN